MPTLITQDFENTDSDGQVLCKEIRSLWCSILGHEATEINKNDNFFDLGGDSLSASQLISRIQQKYSVRLTLNDLLDNSTIDLLTKFIQKNQTITCSNNIEI